MTLSVNDLVKKIQQGPVNLTLFNDKGESYRAGNITTFKRTNKGVKIRWESNKDFNHIMPLTYAILHRGRKMFTVFGINPIVNSILASELEINYG